MVESYEKLGCPLIVTANKAGIGVYNPGKYPSCNEFCGNGLPLTFGYDYPHKKSNKHHHH